RLAPALVRQSLTDAAGCCDGASPRKQRDLPGRDAKILRLATPGARAPRSRLHAVSGQDRARPCTTHPAARPRPPPRWTAGEHRDCLGEENSMRASSRYRDGCVRHWSIVGALTASTVLLGCGG